MAEAQTVALSGISDPGDSSKAPLADEAEQERWRTNLQKHTGEPVANPDVRATVEQTSVLKLKIENKKTCYVSFTIWCSYQQVMREAVALATVTQADGSKRAPSLKGPSCFKSWTRSYDPFTTSMLEVDQWTAPGARSYRSQIEKQTEQYERDPEFEKIWACVYAADVKASQIYIPDKVRELKRIADTNGAFPVINGYTVSWDPARPFIAAFKCLVADDDDWRTEVEKPVLRMMREVASGRRDAVAETERAQVLREMEDRGLALSEAAGVHDPAKRRRTGAGSDWTNQGGPQNRTQQQGQYSAKQTAAYDQWKAQGNTTQTKGGKADQKGKGEFGSLGATKGKGKGKCYSYNNGQPPCAGQNGGCARGNFLHACVKCGQRNHGAWEVARCPMGGTPATGPPAMPALMDQGRLRRHSSSGPSGRQGEAHTVGEVVNETSRASARIRILHG